MRILIALLLLCCSSAWAAPCPVTVGTLTVRVTTNRTTGVSPLMVWFDASGTTDTAVLQGTNNPVLDISYAWSYGDPGASGTGTWAYGSNPGKNSMNISTGPEGAHLFVLPVAGTTDTTYTVQVWAFDGVTIASCTVAVTAFSPSGANGYAGANTTCVAATTTPVPGFGGCPLGAAAIQTTSFNTALGATHIAAGKRVLFHCGDSFTGDGAVIAVTGWSVGAYGGCENTQSNRPVLTDTGTNGMIQMGTSSTLVLDGRVADLDLEGGSSLNQNNCAVCTVINPVNNTGQLSLYNLISNNNGNAFHFAEGHEQAAVGINVVNMWGIGAYFNIAENNCLNLSTTTYCGFGSYNSANYVPIGYQAVIGSFLNGNGGANAAGGAGVEVLRVSACRFCVFMANTIQNANNNGADLKLHNGNTFNSISTWTGQATEYIEISDNLFTGNTSAQVVEYCPQNGGDDERLRYIITERNVFQSPTMQAQGGRMLDQCGQYVSVRNNAFYMQAASSTQYPIYAVQIEARGTITATNFPPNFNEMYNNVCYAPTTIYSPLGCIGWDSINASGTGVNGFGQNNLYYRSASTGATVVDKTGNNTVSNNTSNMTVNPTFLNASGTFSKMDDFKPQTQAAYQGATSTLSNYFDGCNNGGFSWIGQYTLGAVSQVCP